MDRTVDEVLYREKPYFRPGTALYAMVMFGWFPLLVYFNVPNIIHAFEKAQYLTLAAQTSVLAYVFDLDNIKEGADYYFGLFSKNARQRWRNREQSRSAKSNKTFSDIRKHVTENPPGDPFIYSSANLPLTEGFYGELMQAYDHERDLNNETLVDLFRSQQQSSQSIVKSPFGRQLLMDQIFFIEESTREPVLLNFIRIRPDFRGPKPKKRTPRSTANTATDFGGVLVPGGVQ